MEPIVRKIVYTNKIYEPKGPYSQAVILDRTVYVSGVLGIDKDSGKLVGGGAPCEAKKILENLTCILEEAGSSMENVCKTTVFLACIQDFEAVNNVYKQFFCKNPPARSTFQVGKLPMDARVEIEAIAATGCVKTVPTC